MTANEPNSNGRTDSDSAAADPDLLRIWISVHVGFMGSQCACKAKSKRNAESWHRDSCPKCQNSSGCRLSNTSEGESAKPPHRAIKIWFMARVSLSTPLSFGKESSPASPPDKTLYKS